MYVSCLVVVKRFRSAIPKVRYSEITLMKNVIPEEEPDFHIHTGVCYCYIHTVKRTHLPLGAGA